MGRSWLTATFLLSSTALALAGPGVFDAAVDIGNPLGRGSTTLNGSTYTLKGTGVDIGDSGDQLHLAYKLVTGDFVMTFRLKSRSTSPAGAGSRGRYGLMARWGTEPNAKYSLLAALLPTVDGGGVPAAPPFYQYRLKHLQNDGNRVNYRLSDDQERSPSWMRLIRMGQATYGYVAGGAGESPGAWMLVGSDSAPDLPARLLVGVCLQSQTEGIPGEITFDHMTIEQPQNPPPPACAPGDSFSGTDFNNGFGVLAGAVRPVRRGGDIEPSVIGGRLRLTETGHHDTSTAVWFELPGAELLTRNGFRAEFDAYASTAGIARPSLVGDGMTFAVVEKGAEILRGSSVRCTDDLIPAVVGDVCDSQISRAACDENQPLSRIDVKGGHIGDGGGKPDGFAWLGADLEGDFEIAIEIRGRQNTAVPAGWSPYGIMARASADPLSQFTMIQTQTYSDSTTLASRSPGGSLSLRTFAFPTSRADFLRLTRRGNVLQGWASNVPPQNPCDDAHWWAGPADDWGANAPRSLKVGIASCVDPCTVLQSIAFPFLECNEGLLDLGGASGGALGYGGGKLRERTPGHPSFAIELDSWVGGGQPGNDPPDAGATAHPGRYHFGLDVNAEASSIHTSSDLGVPPASLPNLFAAAGIHVVVDYAPSGHIRVVARPNPPPAPETLVLSYRIPPLSGPVLLGFTAGTAAGTSQQEIDNFSVSLLRSCGGTQKPGDCNQDGRFDISDAACLLGHLFLGRPESLPCGDGSASHEGNQALVDLNGDARVDLSDAVYGLFFLFSGGPPPELGVECTTISGCPSACNE